APCRSGVNREQRHRAFSHGRRGISHTRFYGSDQWPERRLSRYRFRPGQVPSRRNRKAAHGELTASAKGAMTPPLYIAVRFLTHRKRALLLSLTGVVFGVAFFICTQAQTQGFARYFINSTLGSNGGLIVRSRFQPRYSGALVPPKTSRGNATHRQYFEGVRNPNEIMRVSRQFSNVVSCSPVLRGMLSARSGFENATVDLYGIEPARHLQTTNLGQQITDGSYDDFRNKPNSVIVGSRLA